jgi:hypothetical protein
MAEEDERRLISAVFGIAGRAGESHLRSRSASPNHSKTKDAWKLSLSLAERILDCESRGKVAPTFREIVSRFGNQERSRFVPFVGMLVGLGVLILEGKRYSSDEVYLLEMEEGWNMAP